MLRKVLLAAMSVAAFVVVPAAASAATSTSVTVYGTSGPVSQGGTGYVDTGVTLGAGQQAQVTASGTWCGGPGWCFGPSGSGSQSLCGTPGVCPAVADAGALVGSLDGGATWFSIGAGPTTVTGPGTLLLAFNDSWYGDNSGSVTATITVSSPLPSSADQCKNGGWQQYGVFKNQGDCVSFVATGGRNQPSGA